MECVICKTEADTLYSRERHFGGKPLSPAELQLPRKRQGKGNQHCKRAWDQLELETQCMVWNMATQGRVPKLV